VAATDEELFPGEHINWDPSIHAVPAEAQTDEVINDRYVRGDIRIVVEQARYPLKQVPELIRSADYNLQPEFQRRPRWSVAKQSRLIESFIINVPVPPVFLYETELSRYEVMDGRQRLTAIADFYDDRFALEGLTEWPELNGRTYRELPDQVRRGIDRRYLSSIVLLHETAKSPVEADRLKQLVFERINTGGEDLSDQEKRNALHPGVMNDLCIELSRHPSFCRMWDIPEPESDELRAIAGEVADWVPPLELAQNPAYKTMEDVQLVLRFFAHRQRTRLWRSGALDEYLTAYLTHANNFDDRTISDLGDLFTRTCDLVFDVLGFDAFRPYRDRKYGLVKVSRPALTVYDPMMLAFSRMLDYGDTLVERSRQIETDLLAFYRENATAFDGRKVNVSDIETRDRIVDTFLRRYLD
jgi:hypothetical protein